MRVLFETISFTMKKAFTLVEIIMVVLIIGILSWILFKTYITMSQISFRVEQQKIVNQELLFLSETLQNLANRNQIDYQKYWEDLIDLDGISETLYMSGEDWEISIYASGNCLDIDEELTREDLNKWCGLVLEKGDKIIDLTNNLVYTTKPLFKIIPFVNSEAYIDNSSLCDSNYLACVNDPWFWFTIQLYNKWYDEKNWTNNVSMFVQEFFNV